MSDGDRSKGLATRIGVAFLIGLLVVCAVIGWGFSKQAEYSWDANNNYSEYTRNTYYPAYYPCIWLSGQNKTNCVAKARNAAREYARNEQDLVAQRNSALWAFIMGAAAVIGAVLSAVGVFLVWTTFNATKEGNEITRKIGEAQVRAYLTFVGKDGRYMVRDDWFLVEIPISNSGQSPAVPLKIDSFFSFRIPPDSNKEENTVTSSTFWERITKGWGAETVRVASGERDLIVSFDEVNLFSQLGTVDQTNAILNVIRNGESQFEMFCRADWQDVFEGWHTLYLHYISTKAVKQTATADHKDIVKGGLVLMSETTYRPQSWPNHP